MSSTTGHVRSQAGSAPSVRNATARVAAWGLPPELEALALQVADLSRLRGRARADIAGTVAEEIASQLRAGIPASDIPRRLGDPRTLAAGLRRERLRARALPLRLLSGWKTVVLGVVILVALVYSGMLVWFHTARPNVSRNFAAEFNARYDAMAEADKAAPVYVRAFELIPDMPEDLRNSGLTDVMPGSELWPRMVEFLSESGPGLALVRQAAAMPHLALPLSDEAPRGWALSKAGRAVEITPGTENPSMIGVLLPQLGTMRQLARTFAADALVAAEGGDGERAKDDLIAMLGVARHARETPFLICDLVAIAITALEVNRMGMLIEKYPGLFTDAQLAELARALEEAAVGGDAIRFEGERLHIHDMVQRTYTDNGRGDGRLCAQGLRTMRQLTVMTGAAAPTGDLTPAEWFFGPVIAFTSATRKELLAEYDKYMSMVETGKRRPRWQGQGPSMDAAITNLASDPVKSRRFQLLLLLLPALEKATQSGQHVEQVRDGGLVTIALERHRLAHGRYPDTLDALVPAFLASIPRDGIDGNPIRYRLKDSRPVVYSIGADHDDDGGRPPAGKNGNMFAWSSRLPAAQAPDGDFILWPEPKEVPLGGEP